MTNIYVSNRNIVHLWLLKVGIELSQGSCCAFLVEFMVVLVYIVNVHMQALGIVSCRCSLIVG